MPQRFYGNKDLALETAKLGMEVGAPVPLPEKFRGNSHAHTPIAPSKEEIAAYHAAFVAAEERLFERTKSKHGVRVKQATSVVGNLRFTGN